MPFKLDANGNLVTEDAGGRKLPVFIHPDGREAAFDADSTLSTISRLNGEAKTHRERAEAAEKSLKPFVDAGIVDPAAAAKALQTVANLDHKKLVDAGEVEKVKTEAIASVEAKYKPIVEERDQLNRDLDNEVIGGSFARSPFIVGDKAKVVIPPDMMQSQFGRYFKRENGRLVARYADGQEVFSPTRHGELANFDEAIEMLVDRYPHKSSILKGSGASGGGATTSGVTTGGKATMARAAFEELPANERMAKAPDMATGKLVLTD